MKLRISSYSKYKVNKSSDFIHIPSLLSPHYAIQPMFRRLVQAIPYKYESFIFRFVYFRFFVKKRSFDVIWYNIRCLQHALKFQHDARVTCFVSCVHCFIGSSLVFSDLVADDILTSIAFNEDGNLLATGDTGGRVAVLQRDSGKSACRFKFLTEFQSHLPGFDSLRSVPIKEHINKVTWCKNATHAATLLSTNDKVVKLWKIQESTSPQESALDCLVSDASDLHMPSLCAETQQLQAREKVCISIQEKQAELLQLLFPFPTYNLLNAICCMLMACYALLITKCYACH